MCGMLAGQVGVVSLPWVGQLQQLAHHLHGLGTRRPHQGHREPFGWAAVVATRATTASVSLYTSTVSITP